MQSHDGRRDFRRWLLATIMFERRLDRALTDDERATLLRRLDELDGDRLRDVALDLAAADLAAWLADPASR